MIKSLIFPCCGSICLGIAVVVVFIALLSLYGVSESNMPPTAPQTAFEALKFPENEQMLDTLSRQLVSEGTALSKIEPAGGSKMPASTTKKLP